MVGGCDGRNARLARVVDAVVGRVVLHADGVVCGTLGPEVIDKRGPRLIAAIRIATQKARQTGDGDVRKSHGRLVGGRRQLSGVRTRDT